MCGGPMTGPWAITGASAHVCPCWAFRRVDTENTMRTLCGHYAKIPNSHRIGGDSTTAFYDSTRPFVLPSGDSQIT